MVKKQNIKVIDDIGIDKEETSEKEPIQIDNVEKKEMADLDNIKLNELKAMLASSKTEVKTEKIVSLKFGVVGLGHAGSRLAEEFYKLGYDAIAINTATQDLVNIAVPEENKLFLDVGIQGAAKNLSIGEAAAVQYKEQIQGLLYNKLSACQVIILATSLGGGSGAGSVSTVIEIANTTGKPIILMAVLPKASEDSLTKSNSLETLSKLSAFVAEGRCQSLILVDNAKIESINAGIGQMQFYKVANKFIVEPLDILNVKSMCPSEVKALDSAELSMILLNSTGIITYGSMTVYDYEGELALSKAVIDSLQKNMLVSGLDFSKARYAGFILIANQNVWNKISTGPIDYCSAIINDIFGNPESIYKGLYIDNDIKEDVVKIISIAAGLGLPDERINTLKKEIDAQQINLKAKEIDRTQSLKVDLGKDSTVMTVDRIKKEIAAKMSGFGKLSSLTKK